MKFLTIAFLALAINSSFAAEKSQSINLLVTEKGFEPSTINVKPGTNVELKITRKTNSTCAREILIPSKNIKKELPLNKTVNIQTGKLEKGEITFACGMNMVTGVIVVK
jgi:plastocyanin domain-containing protein